MTSSHKHGHVSADFAIVMILLGAFGTMVHLAIIGFAAVEYRQIFKVGNLIPKWSTHLYAKTSAGKRRQAAKRKKRRVSGTNQYVKKKRFSASFLFMEFSMWTSNLLACAIWFLLRTDLLFWGARNKQFDRQFCHRIYLANFLFFFYGKMLLHLLLVYRMHITFEHTVFAVSNKLMGCLGLLIVASSISQITLFVLAVLHEADVDYAHGTYLRVCTVYGNSQHQYFHSRREFPILFGVTDSLIDTLTIGLFVKQMFAVASKSKDPFALVIIRKLTVLGIVDVICSLFLYTFAMPFYPHLIVLMPLDAVIDSLCVFLVSQFAHTFYNVLCLPCDRVAETAMEFAEESSSTSGGGHPSKRGEAIAANDGQQSDECRALSTLPSVNHTSTLTPVLEHTSSASMLMDTRAPDDGDTEEKTDSTLQAICCHSDKGPTAVICEGKEWTVAEQ